MRKNYILLNVCSFLLIGCSSDIKKTLLNDLINGTNPIIMNVYNKVEKEIMVEFYDDYSYSIQQNENTTLSIYDNEELLYTKNYHGSIHHFDNSNCIFFLNDKFYYLITYKSNIEIYYDLMEVSKTGEETIILSSYYDYDFNYEEYIYFYLDDYDNSFYIGILDSDSQDYILEKYSFDSLELKKTNTWLNMKLYKGIKNIFHFDSETILLTNNGRVYRDFTYFTSGVSTNLFNHFDNKYYFYGFSTGDYGINQYNFSLYSLNDIYQTTGERDIFTTSKLPKSLICKTYSYKKFGLFVLFDGKSIFSILIYDFDREELFSFSITDEQVIDCWLHGHKLYFTSKKLKKEETLSYIELSDWIENKN